METEPERKEACVEGEIAVKLKAFDGKVIREFVPAEMLASVTKSSHPSSISSSISSSPCGSQIEMHKALTAHGKAKSEAENLQSPIMSEGGRTATTKPSGNPVASPFASRTPQYHHHPQGSHFLRSDAYLRQALTSPYNQRTDKRSVFPDSPRSWQGGSPCLSLWREGGGGARSHRSPRKEGVGGGVRYHSSPLKERNVVTPRQNCESMGCEDRHGEEENRVSPVSDFQATFKTPKMKR